MNKNEESILRILNANKGVADLREYVEEAAKNDPNFFRWLFDCDFEKDFDSSLSAEQREKYDSWLKSFKAKH